MQQIGVVLQTEGDFATVRIMRTDACSSCHTSCHGGCAQVLCVRAENLCNAVVGDTVCVESKTFRILAFSAIVFLLPVLLGLVTYFMTPFLFLQLRSFLSVMVGGIAFLTGGFLCNRTLLKNPDVRITQRILPNLTQNGVTDDRT